MCSLSLMKNINKEFDEFEWADMQNDDEKLMKFEEMKGGLENGNS